MKLAELPPLSLYVHIPWCLRKCPYCDFNSHEKREDVPEEQYVDAVVADLESALPNVWGRRLHTIFIGGGTPSLFTPQAIDRLLTACARASPSIPPRRSRWRPIPGPSSASVSRVTGMRA
jgi:oxygen-independent coproporphyrinogen-3 oxidase